MHSQAAKTGRADAGQGILWFLSRMSLIALGSLAIGIVLPGAVSLHSGTFFAETMTKIVAQKHPDVASKLVEFETAKTRTKEQLRALDISANADPAELATQKASRNSLQEELQKKPPASVQPYYLHVIMYFWPIMYFGLGVTALLLRPPIKDANRFYRRPWQTLSLAGGIVIFNLLPLWFRTLCARNLNQGRTVFAYTNPDIDPASFVVQNLNLLIFSIVLAAIWVEWAAWGDDCVSAARDRRAASINAYEKSVEMLSLSITRWQLAFMSISVGFFIYTAIFWNQIIVNGDGRFGLEAIVAHCLWAVTATLTAVPVVLRWRNWQHHKSKVIVGLIENESDSDTMGNKLAALLELKPVGAWNIPASLIAVVTSFAAPVIQALIKKGP